MGSISERPQTQWSHVALQQWVWLLTGRPMWRILAHASLASRNDDRILESDAFLFHTVHFSHTLLTPLISVTHKVRHSCPFSVRRQWRMSVNPCLLFYVRPAHTDRIQESALQPSYQGLTNQCTHNWWDVLGPLLIGWQLLWWGSRSKRSVEDFWLSSVEEIHWTGGGEYRES